MNQTKQVFVDDTGRRGRLLTAAIRVACVVVVAYLALLVAGFLGASWVPSVRLPIVGDIFDADRGPSFTGAGDATDSTEDGAVTSAAGDPPEAAALQSGGDDAQADAVTGDRSDAQGAAASGGSSTPGKSGGPHPAMRPTPKASPNHGTSSGNPNAGPKPRPTHTPKPQPSPNRGSNGNSENAGPKPKPSKDPGHPSNNFGNSRNQEPEPSPSPGT